MNELEFDSRMGELIMCYYFQGFYESELGLNLWEYSFLVNILKEE